MKQASNLRRAVNAWLDEYLKTPDRVAWKQLRGLGPVAELEAKLAQMHEVKHAVAFPNATTALLATAIACELSHAEIIVPEHHWGGTWAPFALLGNRPLFAKCRRSSRNIIPSEIARIATPATRAVIAMDNETPHDSRALRKACDQHGLLYIADAARSFGLRRGGKPASAFADAIIFSFGPGKRLSAVEGGAVLTNSTSLYECLLLTAQHPERYRRECSLTEATDRQPLNGRMHPLAAILALAQIRQSLQAPLRGTIVGAGF